MKVSRRDSLFMAAIALLIGVLAFGTGKGKGKGIPLDDRHRPSYKALESGKSRPEVELVCTTCHSESSLPLPKGHPPKEQCLLCHKQLPS
jgi:hypothetical protein